MFNGRTCSWDAALMCRLSLDRRKEDNDNVAGVEFNSMRFTSMSHCIACGADFSASRSVPRPSFASAETLKSLWCIIKTT